MFKLKFIECEPNESRRSPHRRLILPGILIVLTITAFAVGLIFGRYELFGEAKSQKKPLSQLYLVTGKGAEPAIKTVKFNLYWDIWQRVQEKYIGRPIKDDTLFYGSIEGLVASLGDPYSVFLRPEKAERFSQDLTGSFSGIGAELGMKKEMIVIIAPLDGSPAERAGIKAGDKIFAVDGADTAGWTLDEAVQKIRGPRGTIVKLKIWREGLEAPQDIAIVRDVIKIKSLVFKYLNQAGKEDANGAVAYLKISNFNEEAAGNFDKAAREIKLKNPTALIVDLRNNPGGFLDIAVRLASEWISEGVVVKEKFSDGREEVYQSFGKHRLTDLLTIVLVNEGSASASEILAGALQDYGQATVIGQKTFGKGSVQDYEQLPDGSALKVTVAEWFTPKGRKINKNGIEPDRVVVLPEGSQEPGQDLVLEEALKLIK